MSRLIPTDARQLPQRWIIRMDFLPGECWQWTGSINGGRGVTSVNGVVAYIHRAVWETLREPLRTGERLIRTCQTRGCTNPDHHRVDRSRLFSS